MNIKCDSGVINVLRANYGRQSILKCRDHTDNRRAPIFTTDCTSRGSFEIVNFLCTNHQECSIPANSDIFGDPCAGTSKYLEVKYQCVKRNDRSDCRGVSVSPMMRMQACESFDLNIKCEKGDTISVVRANFGRTSRGVCNSNGNAPIYTDQCFSPNSLNIASRTCSGKSQCTLTADSATFGDPCVGTNKYLEVEYQCAGNTNCRANRESTVDPLSPTTLGLRKVVACEGSNLEVKCGQGEKISVSRANFGRTSRDVCTDNGNAPIYTDKCFSPNSLDLVNRYCSGQNQCTGPASSAIFGNPCVGTFKYLEVEYTCTAV